MAAKQNQSLRAFVVPSASVDICLYNKTYLCVYIWIVLAGRVHNLSFVVPNHSGRAGSKSQLRNAKSQWHVKIAPSQRQIRVEGRAQPSLQLAQAAGLTLLSVTLRKH